MKQKLLFILASLFLLGLFIGGALYVKQQQQASQDALIAANQQALNRGHAPTYGPADARVTITEFLDPACEACAAFYPFVKDLMRQQPEQIRLVVRYAPLHDGAAGVVAALEAARLQGQYWPALEKLLATQSQWAINHRADVGLALAQLAPLGLDMARLQQDMQSEQIMAILRQDIADAQALGINKTPSYFVNGRPLQDFGYEQLATMVQAALATSPARPQQ
ncbi:DsbA family protein [Chitinilyticum piscinae]|uniref:Thioredoxin domain-containing protein n=1 Tax=Chitinilyticum piscinae TaxID=2866724 RepID=A0A8J7FEG3_9NEIS|nr:thioredoxin domain-containing protein [Chitinilyticum piscinae]MBE9607908.1 thioredoxin domain-containing protein [Chitinilyticum piscinae]